MVGVWTALQKKKILLGNVYREWQYLGQSDSLSLSSNSQVSRWNLFLEKWEAALKEDNETLVVGDLNLDFLKWTQPNYR